MTLRELINSVDPEQYSESALYQELRETKPEYSLCKLFVSQNLSYFPTIAKCVSIPASLVLIHRIYTAIAAQASASAKAW